METELFIAIGVFPIELLVAYQVSTVCTANSGQDNPLKSLDIILG